MNAKISKELKLIKQNMADVYILYKERIYSEKQTYIEINALLCSALEVLGQKEIVSIYEKIDKDILISEVFKH